MKSEAAIYLPPEKLENPKPDYNRVASTKNTLTGSLVNAHLKNINIDTYTVSKNLTLHGKTEFAQRYAVGALTKIINKQPVTNKTMLDSLFNTYAPSLNASLEQTGYNSLMQMKDAVANGTVNPSTFLTGFSNALNAIQEEKDFLYRRKKYGKEIPIDLVTKCDYTYDLQIAKHPTPLGKDAINYIKDFGTVNIIVSAHVKNETAEIWQMSDYSNKLTDAMLQKQFVVFRIGNTDILFRYSSRYLSFSLILNNSAYFVVAVETTSVPRIDSICSVSVSKAYLFVNGFSPTFFIVLVVLIVNTSPKPNSTAKSSIISNKLLSKIVCNTMYATIPIVPIINITRHTMYCVFKISFCTVASIVVVQVTIDSP